MCLSVWELILTGPEFPLLKDFSEYLRGAKVPVVTKDMWAQARAVHTSKGREGGWRGGRVGGGVCPVLARVGTWVVCARLRPWGDWVPRASALDPAYDREIEV